MEYIRRFENLFPDADKDDDVIGDENPVGDFAWEIYSRTTKPRSLNTSFRPGTNP